MEFSQTRLGEWRRCRQRYQWKYVDSIPTASSPGQKRGTAGHRALAFYYGNGQTPNAMSAGMRMALNELAGADLEGDRDLITKILQRYYKYAQVHDVGWKVVAVEKKFVGKIGPYSLQGYIDLLLEIEDEFVIVDHKFQKDGTVEGALLSTQLA